MSRIAPRLSAALVTLAASLALAAPASADVPPGFDLFETDPSNTVFSFREEFTIPPNFFDQGSEPFQGDVIFGGVPLVNFRDHGSGNADTVVRRLQAAPVTGPGSQATIPIELVALSLQSVAPIEVRVGGETQLWDASAVPSQTRRSQGEMRIVQTGGDGGAFDSALQVYPRFTFKRLSDNETRTLDVGAANLQPQSQQKLVLRANEVPWRTLCIPPALAVPGLNDGFCPSFTPSGESRPAVEQAPAARHTVRPAQRRLEHLNCYAQRPPDSFTRRNVQLEDQFGTRTARVLRPSGLCNPAQKNEEPFENRRAHLECYLIDRVSPQFASRQVRVRNQFGPDALTVVRPSSICLPTSKSSVRTKPRALKAKDRIDHQLCYSVRGSSFKRRVVRVRDQFGRARLRLLRVERLCVPVRKNTTPVEHPVSHLVCYRTEKLSGPTLPRTVRVRNQFRRARATVTAPGPVCVPSLKVAVP